MIIKSNIKTGIAYNEALNFHTDSTYEALLYLIEKHKGVVNLYEQEEAKDLEKLKLIKLVGSKYVATENGKKLLVYYKSQPKKKWEVFSKKYPYIASYVENDVQDRLYNEIGVDYDEYTIDIPTAYFDMSSETVWTDFNDEYFVKEGEKLLEQGY
jgi:hypothetical protein